MTKRPNKKTRAELPSKLPAKEVVAPKADREKDVDTEKDMDEETEVLDLFEDPDADNPHSMYEQLEEMGIALQSETGDGLFIEPDEDDLEEVEEEGIDESRMDGAGLADDPVRMYLKEIGQVQLLDSNRETWLSSQMAAVTLLNAVAKTTMGQNGVARTPTATRS